MGLFRIWLRFEKLNFKLSLQQHKCSFFNGLRDECRTCNAMASYGLQMWILSGMGEGVKRNIQNWFSVTWKSSTPRRYTVEYFYAGDIIWGMGEQPLYVDTMLCVTTVSPELNTCMVCHIDSHYRYLHHLRVSPLVFWSMGLASLWLPFNCL